MLPPLFQPVLESEGAFNAWALWKALCWSPVPGQRWGLWGHVVVIWERTTARVLTSTREFRFQSELYLVGPDRQRASRRHQRLTFQFVVWARGAPPKIRFINNNKKKIKKNVYIKKIMVEQV